jgi:hypothetical protein
MNGGYLDFGDVQVSATSPALDGAGPGASAIVRLSITERKQGQVPDHGIVVKCWHSKPKMKCSGSRRLRTGASRPKQLIQKRGKQMVSVNRKFSEGVRVVGKEEGPASFRGRAGLVLGYLTGSGYQVGFDDGRIEYAYAHWLESIPVVNQQ